MEQEMIDFNILAEKIHEQELKRHTYNGDLPYRHYLMLVAKALGESVRDPQQGLTMAAPDYRQFTEDIGRGFDVAYTAHFIGTPFDCMAEAAIRIFDLLENRGIGISGMDNFTINRAPKGFADENHFPLMTLFVFDLIGTLTHISEKDCGILECLKLYEQNPADKELEKAIEETFGEVENADDIEIRTSYGFENYIIHSKLIPVLCAIASWFKKQGGKGLVWHINARLYYLSHFE